jgi:hypothetical protein
MIHTQRLLWRVSFSALTIGIATVSGSVWLEASQYEAPPVFTASQALPPDLAHSPNYTVGERVGLENFQYVYQLETKWGAFNVKGSDFLRVRAREIAATAKLETVTGAGTAVAAAGKTAMRPVETAKDLVTAPGKTISDTVKGVGRIFGSADAAMHATDPHNESILASVTGGATARRKLAFDLGVDPNTSFPPLSDELKRVATASAVGETSANVGLSFVAGPAGIAIGAGGTATQVREMLRDKSAADLEKDGRKSLVSMGMPLGTIDAFYANPNLSPTDKTVIVEALERLGNIDGRELFVAGAARAPSIEMGFFYRHQAMLIWAYNKRIARVHGFVRVGGAPMLATAKGTVSILPVDYLIWSAPLAELATTAKHEHGAGELWITGRASPTVTSKLSEIGWKVIPNVEAQLGNYPELAGWN